MLLYVTLKRLPELRIFIGYFIVQLLNVAMRLVYVIVLVAVVRIYLELIAQVRGVAVTEHYDSFLPAL